MSDNSDDGFPGFQIGTFVKGDHFVFRANSGEEMDELLKGAQEKGNDIFDNLEKFKQVVIAKGVFSADGNGNSKPPPRKATGSRAKDSGPPPDDIQYYSDSGKKWATGDGVDCKHGPRLDLRGKGYKADLYCSLETDDFKKKCQPIKVGG